jgi:hypothetical protein
MNWNWSKTPITRRHRNIFMVSAVAVLCLALVQTVRHPSWWGLFEIIAISFAIGKQLWSERKTKTIS